MWLGAIIKQLGKTLHGVLECNLNQIHHTLRVSTNVEDLIRVIEKYFGVTANYAKGKGSMFMYYMNTFHPDAYLFHVARACGGTRQDIGTEGAVPILMNIPYYLEFLVWRMMCGAGDGILEKNLFILLRSVKMVALLRVLTILHVSVTMPLRWLAGNCGDLSEHDFGVAHMPEVLDILDYTFLNVVGDGQLLLSADVMMHEKENRAVQ